MRRQLDISLEYNEAFYEGKPLEPQVMKSIRVETNGQTYPFDQM